MDYHLFRKTISGKNAKSVKRWYYWFYDSDGKQVKKSCINCSTKVEAEEFISKIPSLTTIKKQKTVAQIAEFMYIRGSEHYNRMIQLGKSIKRETLVDARIYIKFIIRTWGNNYINELTTYTIQNKLLSIERSGSWKNRVLEIFLEIFREAIWQEVEVSLPTFTRFKRNTQKQSILSAQEMETLFSIENFSSEMFYIFFLVCLSAGMRLGEVRALRTCQFLEDRQAIVIDGFLTREGNRNPFNKTGSVDNPRFRVTLIPKMIVSLLKYWIIKNNYESAEYLFTYDNKPVRMELAGKEFQRALKKAGIQTQNRKLTPHALRYTYVTRTRRLVDINSAMLMSGHSSEQMSDYYNQFELEETLKLLQPLKSEINKFLPSKLFIDGISASLESDLTS